MQFCWHGGEPLLAGINFFEKIVFFQKKYLEGILKYENVVQTNGLFMTEDFLNFFQKKDFKIGFSLDVPDYLSNKYRFPPSTANSMIKKITEIFKIIKCNRLPLVVIAVIHDGNADKADMLYHFFRDIGADTVNFNPQFLQKSNENVDIAKYISFAKRILDLRDKDRALNKETFNLGVIDDIKRISEGKKTHFCFFTNQCHKFININRDGEIFNSCVDMPGFKIGSIFDKKLHDIISSNDEKEIGELQQSLIPVKINGLDFSFGCPKRRENQKDAYLDAYIHLANELKNK